MDSGLQAALVQQVGLELYSALCYRRISNLASQSWPGIEHWARDNAKDEFKDYTQFQIFLNDRGVTDSLKVVPLPKDVGNEPASWLQAAMSLEDEVLAHLTETATAASGVGDRDALTFIEGYLEDQRKAIAHLVVLVTQAQAAVGDVAALQALDKRIGKRGK